MWRFQGKNLALLAIVLVLANAGCLARCIVESCQQSPPPCHSHTQGVPQHCPQQNQMKLAATGPVAFDWGIAFIPADSATEAAQAEQTLSLVTEVIMPAWTRPAPLALRI